MSLLRHRLRAESALTPALEPVPGNQHTCITRLDSTACSASCRAGRQRMGKGECSVGNGVGWRAELDFSGETHHRKAGLILQKTYFLCQIACNFMTHHQGQMTTFIKYSLNPECSHTQNSNSWRIHPLDLLLQLFLPFCLSTGKVMLKSIYFLMSPLSRSAQLMQGFLKQVESVWWIKCEHSGNSTPTRPQGLAPESVCDIGYKQLYTPSVLCIFLYLLTKLSIFKEKWRNKKSPFFAIAPHGKYHLSRPNCF